MLVKGKKERWHLWDFQFTEVKWFLPPETGKLLPRIQGTGSLHRFLICCTTFAWSSNTIPCMHKDRADEMFSNLSSHRGLQDIKLIYVWAEPVDILMVESKTWIGIPFLYSDDPNVFDLSSWPLSVAVYVISNSRPSSSYSWLLIDSYGECINKSKPN